MWITEPLAKGLRFGPYGGVQIESLNHSGYCWQVGSHSLTFNYKHCFPSWITGSSLRYSPRIWNISCLWDLKLSQQCCWIFKSSGMWHFAVAWIVPTIHRTELPAPSVPFSLGLLNHNIDANTGNYSLSNTVTHPKRPDFSCQFPLSFAVLFLRQCFCCICFFFISYFSMLMDPNPYILYNLLSEKIITA